MKRLCVFDKDNKEFEFEIELIAWNQTSDRDGTSGENTGLFKVKDKTTGETGHFLYFLDWCSGRDIARDELMTDNPKLKWPSEESPSIYPTFDPHQRKTKKDARKHPAYDKCSHTIYGG